jgi:hypothetical protein
MAQQKPTQSLNRLSWPPLRSDVMAVVAIAICVYCVVTTTWPVIAVTALVGAVFCAVSPRMKGRWGFKTPSASVGGEFVSPFEEATPAGPGERSEQAPVPEPAPRRESDAG